MERGLYHYPRGKRGDPFLLIERVERRSFRIRRFACESIPSIPPFFDAGARRTSRAENEYGVGPFSLSCRESYP